MGTTHVHQNHVHHMHYVHQNHSHHVHQNRVQQVYQNHVHHVSHNHATNAGLALVQELVLAPQVAVTVHHVDSPHNHVATHHHVPHNHVDSHHNRANSDHVVHRALVPAHVFQQV